MENQPNDICRNCQQPLPPAAKFCPQCGQKNTDGRLTFGELMGQFFDHLLNLDARIFRTLKDLVFPGKLTVEYFRGRHIRYYHPVRLFIVAGAVFIAVISVVINENEISRVNAAWENQKARHIRHEELLRLDSLQETVDSAFARPSVSAAMDTLMERFHGGEDTFGEDSTAVIYDIVFGIDSLDNPKLSKKVAIKDLMNLDEEAIADKYDIKGFKNRLVFMQYIRIQKSAGKLVFYLIGNALWMMLIMMPMLALVLKLLYFRRPYYYFEHLVFSFHTHTFVFLLFGLTLLIDKYAHTTISPFVFLVAPVYLVMAMKRFYGQGWIKTIVKFLIANLTYSIIFNLALLLTLVVSLILF